MLDLDKYEELRHRPKGRPAMRQQWRDLSFLHYSCPQDEVQAALPAGLTVDTYPDEQGRESAWVGLVPFRMQNVTPAGIPPIPGCHAFPETNVRTYVHCEGRRPGVWFFSLDATNAFACRYARALYHLPYHHARMSVERAGERLHYQNERISGSANVDLEVSVGAPFAVKPGTLEFFLVERYLLYAERKGRLFTGRVSHQPYQVKALKVSVLNESLVAAAGLRPKLFTHSLFSEGVDVEVFSVQPA